MTERASLVRCFVPLEAEPSEANGRMLLRYLTCCASGVPHEARLALAVPAEPPIERYLSSDLIGSTPDVPLFQGPLSSRTVRVAFDGMKGRGGSGATRAVRMAVLLTW